MKLLSWNIRGLGRSEKRRKIRNIVQERMVDVLFLQETKKVGVSGELVKSIWPYNDMEYMSVDADGFSGGILCVWKASVFSLAKCCSSRNFIILSVVFMQGPIVKKYPAKLRLRALQCFFSCIQSAIWAIAMERNISSWKLSWDLSLLSVACCGVIVTGVAYWLRVWIIEKKGPVFVATFTPLALIITVIFSSIFWKESFYWGSACGCVMLVGGLYSVEFMKANETKEEIRHN